MSFELSHTLAGHHLIVQPSDAALNPPEAYFYVQDGLMIACGVLYVQPTWPPDQETRKFCITMY